MNNLKNGKHFRIQPRITFRKNMLILLSITIIFIIFSSSEKSVSAASESYEYTVNNGQITIDRYKHNFYDRNANNVDIPRTINGNIVTTIGDRAFYRETQMKQGDQAYPIKSVIIPSTVSEIGEYAFARNDIEKITIPSNVTTIKSGAFNDNRLKNKLIIPNNVTELGSSAFSDNNLTEVDITTGITKIPDNAFNRNNLETLTIPDNITRIGKRAFWSNSLTDLTIPVSVTEIGDHAFWDNELERVEILGNITMLEEYVFYGNNLTDVILPDSLIEIGENGFGENSLMEITLPASVRRIGESAFSRNEFTEFTIPTTVTHIDDYAFLDNHNLTDVTVYNENLNFGEHVFRNFVKNNPQDITIHGQLGSTAEAYADEYDHRFNPLEPTIESVEQLDNIKVDNGTELDRVPLPEQIEVTLVDGSKQKMGVDWMITRPDQYKKYQPGRYSFTGNLQLSTDVRNPDEIQPSVDIIIDKPYIVSVEELAPVKAVVGTAQEEINFPNKLQATLNDESSIDLEIDWNDSQPAYNESEAGIYTFTGEPVLTDEIINKENIKATVKVTLEPKLIIELLKKRVIIADRTYQIQNKKTHIMMPKDLPEDTTLSIQEYVPSESTLGNLELAGDSFTFKFDYPTDFTRSTQGFILTLGFEQNADPDQIGIYYLDGNEWVLQEGGVVDLDNNTITIPVPHFSTYAVFEKATIGDVDKGALEDLIGEAMEYESIYYTFDSFYELENAIGYAMGIVNYDDDATQSDVNAAIKQLEAAMEALVEVEVVQFSELEGLFYEYVEAPQRNYTDESWITLKNELEAAGILLSANREQTTQEEVDAAYRSLLDAVEGLEEKEELPEPKEPIEGEPGDPIDPPKTTDPEPKTILAELGKEYDVNANDTISIQAGDANATITMPDNLAEGTRVIVEDARDRAETTGDGNLMIAGDVFDVSIIGPDDEKVHGPFTLTLGYDNDKYRAEEVAIYYYDEDQGIWEKLDGEVNEKEGTITIEVDHFSMYGVFATSTPVVPKEQDKESKSDLVVKVEEKIDEGEQVSDTENALPKTATNTFNMIVIGLILIVLGGMSLVLIRNKVMTK